MIVFLLFGCFIVMLCVFCCDIVGLVFIEFVYGFLVLFGIGLGGVEVVNLVVMWFCVSQFGMMIVDNMVCVGILNGLVLKKIYEFDVVDVFEVV